MGYINNKYGNSGPKYDFNSKDLPYMNCGDFFGNMGSGVFPIRGLYINTKGKYGDTPCIVTDGCIINAPKHLLNRIKDMRSDDTTTELINKGLVMFNVYPYISKSGNTGYSINFSDADPETEIPFEM